MESRTPKEYTNILLEALNVFRCNNRGYAFYDGKEGSLRLAREYGYGLKDFGEEDKKFITSSYSCLCVRFYDLKPFINAKEWSSEILKAFNRA
jgi:hypothetical protein